MHRSRGSAATLRRPLLGSLFLSWALVLAVACNDDDGGADAGGPSRTLDSSVGGLDAGVDAESLGADAGDTGPVLVTPAATPKDTLYVVSTWVSTSDSASTYIKVVGDLAADTKVDLKTGSIEVTGFGDAKVLGNKLYVSDGHAPIVTRYAISEAGAFSEEKKLDFSPYATMANIFQMAFVSPTVAYLVGHSSWVRWNPSTMSIEQETSIPFPESIGERDGIAPYYSYDRGFSVRGKYLFHAVSWFEFNDYRVTPSSLIAVIDTETSKLEALLDAPCPGLDTATTDDVGNIYYSGWAFGPGAVYFTGGAKACAVMIPANSNTLNPNFKLTFADVAGHEAIGLRHIGNDKFIMQVFDEENTGYDPAEDTISDWVYADSWFFATYDAVTHEYKERKDLGYFGGGYYSEKLGGRFFLLSKREATTDYVQLLADGTWKKGITVDGWASRAYPIP